MCLFLLQVPKMDGEWYKLAKPLMASCCDTIRTKILNRFNESSTDLSQLCVQLHRLGDVPWHHLDNVDAMQSFAPKIEWDKVSCFDGAGTASSLERWEGE